MKITCKSRDILPLESLVEFQGGLKNRTSKDINKIITSINKFGFATPFFVWQHDGINHVLDGHGRLLALNTMKSNGEIIPPLPVVFIDCENEEKAKQLLLRITSQYGEMTQESVLEFMDGLELEIEEVALPAGTLDLHIQKEEAEEDDFEVEVPEEPTSKLGQVYKLGNHRLMCGDSTKLEDVEKLMGGVMADLLLTDPPYNVDYTGKTKDALKIQNDKMENDNFRQFLRDAFTNAYVVMKPGACFYIWHADSEGYNFRGACDESGLKVRQCIIWSKNCMVMGRQDYQWQHEPCLYGWKDGAGHLWASDRKQTTILNFNKPSKADLHPTMKPIPLFDYQIKNNTKGGDIVLDLFGGSGTTIMACEQNGRVAYSMEYDPRYVDVIIKRWEEYTGEKAELIEE